MSLVRRSIWMSQSPPSPVPTVGPIFFYIQHRPGLDRRPATAFADSNMLTEHHPLVQMKLTIRVHNLDRADQDSEHRQIDLLHWFTRRRTADEFTIVAKAALLGIESRSFGFSLCSTAPGLLVFSPVGLHWFEISTKFSKVCSFTGFFKPTIIVHQRMKTAIPVSPFNDGITLIVEIHTSWRHFVQQMAVDQKQEALVALVGLPRIQDIPWESKTTQRINKLTKGILYFRRSKYSLWTSGV